MTKLLTKFTELYRSKIGQFVDMLLFVGMIYLIVSNYNKRQHLIDSKQDIEQQSVLNDSVRYYMIYEGYLFANQQNAISYAEAYRDGTETERSAIKKAYQNYIKRQDSTNAVWDKTKKIETRVEKIVEKIKKSK